MANLQGKNQYSNREKCAFRLLMESQGHNVDTLARVSGLSFSMIQRLAAGATDPAHITLESALKISKAMRLTLPTFVKALGL